MNKAEEIVICLCSWLDIRLYNGAVGVEGGEIGKESGCNIFLGTVWNSLGETEKNAKTCRDSLCPT